MSPVLLVSGLIESVLSAVGAGQDLILAAMILTIAWYGYRALGIASAVGTRASGAIVYVVVVAVAFAVAIGTGVMDPHPDQAVQLGRDVTQFVSEWLLDRLAGVVG